MLTAQTAGKAIAEAESRGAVSMTYDAGGGYAGTLEQAESEQKDDSRKVKVNLCGINGGESATGMVWPDDKTSADKFMNRRAEMAWVLRERFRKTYEYMLWLDKKEGGKEHPLDQLISVPNHADLLSQLSVPLIEHNSDRKLQLESKKKMRERGVPSPDFFDMCCFLFAEDYGGWHTDKDTLQWLNSR